MRPLRPLHDRGLSWLALGITCFVAGPAAAGTIIVGDGELADLQATLDGLPTPLIEPTTIELATSATFAGTLTISGIATSASSPLILGAAEGHAPTFAAQAVNKGAIVVTEPYVELHGLVLLGGGDFPLGQRGVQIVDASEVLVRGCTFGEVATGVILSGSGTSGTRIEDSRFEGPGERGISLIGGATEVEIRHNHFGGFLPVAISLTESTDAGPRNIIAQNSFENVQTILRFGVDGLFQAAPPPGTVFERNASGRYVFYGQSVGVAEWTDRASFFAATGLAEAGADAADLHLRTRGDEPRRPWTMAAGYPIDSPLVDSGVPYFATGADLAGVPRPLGAAADPGPWETRRTSTDPGRPVRLVVSADNEPLLVGESVKVTLTAYDSAGQSPKGFLGTFQITATSEGASPSVAPIATGADGVASFAAASFTVPGEHSLTFTSAEHPELSVTLDGITVTTEITNQCVVRQDGGADELSLGACLEATLGEGPGIPALVEVDSSGHFAEHLDLSVYGEDPNIRVTIRPAAGHRAHLAPHYQDTPILRTDDIPVTFAGFDARAPETAHFALLHGADHIVEDCVIEGSFSPEVNGIEVYGSTAQILGNRLTHHLYGLLIAGANAVDALVMNNLFVDNTIKGVELEEPGGGHVLRFNTFWHNEVAQLGLVVDGAPLSAPISFDHNILVALYDNTLYVDGLEGAELEASFSSDRNLWHLGEDAEAAFLNGEILQTLEDWQAATGLDPTSLPADPLFADPGEDLHLRSEAGRWDGSAWVQDSVTSPAIDAGEANLLGLEPAPNGCAPNLGAWGNTAQASLSPSGDDCPPP